MAEDSDTATNDLVEEAEREGEVMKSVGNLVGDVLSSWEDIQTDVTLTVQEYRENGWDVIALHPGHVTPMATEGEDASRHGLDILVPDNELTDLKKAIDKRDPLFDSNEVYKRTTDGIVFLLVVMKDTDADFAVAYPAYYDPEDGQQMIEEAQETGRLHTYLHDLSDDRVVTFVHEAPALFFPDE